MPAILVKIRILLTAAVMTAAAVCLIFVIVITAAVVIVMVAASAVLIRAAAVMVITAAVIRFFIAVTITAAARRTNRWLRMAAAAVRKTDSLLDFILQKIHIVKASAEIMTSVWTLRSARRSWTMRTITFRCEIRVGFHPAARNPERSFYVSHLTFSFPVKLSLTHCIILCRRARSWGDSRDGKQKDTHFSVNVLKLEMELNISTPMSVTAYKANRCVAIAK